MCLWMYVFKGSGPGTGKACAPILVYIHSTRTNSSLLIPFTQKKQHIIHPKQFDAQMRPVRQPDAAPLLSGAFLMNQQEVEALQERDRRQVRSGFVVGCMCVLGWVGGLGVCVRWVGVCSWVYGGLIG